MKSTDIRRFVPLCACLSVVALSCGDGPAGLNDFVPCDGPEPSSADAGYIHGTVVAAEDDSPVSGAAIRVDGVEGCLSTDGDGRFVFPLAGGGGFRMVVTADHRTHATRVNSVTIGHDTSLGVFALPMRDAAVSVIGPSGGTHRSSKGGLELTFPAGALDQMREVSATRFGAGRELPGKLPETSHFTMALEAVAGDGELDQPVTITIPNDYGFPAGTQVPVGVFDEQTGEWVPDGTGVVSEDGTQVVYVATHFSAFDCNFPVTSSGRPGLVGKDPRRKKDPCKRNGSSGNSIVDIRSGTLRLDFDMPWGRRGGRERSIGLAYQSGAATPWVWTGGPWADESADPKTPEYAGVEVQVEGRLERVYMENNPDGNWAAYMWDGRNQRGEMLPTGLYDGWIRVYGAEKGVFAQADFFGGKPTYSLGIEADELVEADTTITTRFQLINGTESDVGNGWYIKGIPEIFTHADGSAMVVMDGESGGVYLPDVRARIVAGSADATDCGDGSSAINDCLDYPEDLAVAPDGSLLTTDSWSDRIIRIGTDGLLSTVFDGAADGYDFKSVAVSPDGVVYFSDETSGKVYRVTGGAAEFVAGGDVPDIFFGTPTVTAATDLDFDADGNLYIADWPYGLRILTTDGTLKNAYAGPNPDYPAPVAIDVNPDGSVLLAEPMRQRVRLLTADGQLLPVAGLDGSEGFDGDGGPAVKARLYMPSGVARGADGTVYIADVYNDRIRSVGTDGIIRTFAGKSAAAGSGFGDGEPATETVNAEPLAPVVDADGNILAVDRHNGHIWRYDLSTRVFARPPSQNAVLAITDESGYTLETSDTKYEFDAAGKCAAFTDDRGDRAVVTRDGTGRISSIDYAGGDSVTFQYDGQLASITAPGGLVMQLDADSDRNVTGISIPGGVETTLSYDGQGRLTGWQDADGRGATYEPDDYGRVRAVHATDGGTRLYEPLETADLLNDRLAHGEGITPAEPGRAGMGASAKYTDENGGQYQFKYDALGEASEIVMPDGTTVTMGNHTCGMPSVVSVPGAWTRTFFYDEWGRMLVDKGPEGDTDYTWDPETGDLLSISTPGGRMTEFESDSEGRITAIKAGSRTLYAFGYLEGSRLEWMDDAIGRRTTYAWDDDGNLQKLTQSGIDTATFERDDAGNITAITDAVGGRTSFGLDEIGRVKSITDRGGAVHAIGMDHAGQVTSLATSGAGVDDGLSTGWSRDARGRVESVSINGMGPWTLDWLGENLVGAISSPMGRVDATYDARGRVVTRTISEGDPDTPSAVATYTYDVDGHLVAAVDDDSSVTFEYDTLTGALLAVTQQYDGMPGPVTLTYEMDPDGIVTSVGYPALDGFDGGVFYYSYDGPTGLPTDITAPDGRYWDLYRDELGRVTEFEVGWGEELEMTREYDARGYLERIVAYLDSWREDEHTRFEYVVDDDGAILSATDPAGAATYGYDAMRRVASVMKSGPGDNESYDCNGAGDPTDAGYEYDEFRRMTRANGYSYAFDAAGRVVTRTSDADGSRLELTWDGDDNLVRASTFADGSETPEHVVTYGYDALGRRVYRDVDGDRRFFVYDFTDIALEMNESGGVDAFYLHEPHMDNPLGMYRDGEWYACIVDGAGSVRGLVRLSDRTMVRTWRYTAFGRVESSTGDVEFRYGFQGREPDQLTGLIHFRARELDPIAGRFISTDPDKFTSFAGTYAFGGNDPINRRDPTGAGPRAVRAAGEVYSGYNDAKQNLEKYVDSKVSKVGGREAGSAAGYIWKTVGSNMIDNYAKIPLPSPYQSPGPNVTDAAVYLYKAYKAKDPCERAKVGGDVLVDMMPGGDKWLRPMVDNFNNFGNLMNAGN